MRKTKCMRIPWKIKSWLFGVIDKLHASYILHFLQKYVTRRSRGKSVAFNPDWDRHKRSLIKHKATGVVFEFGAGQSLAQNLYLSSVVNKQIVVDLNPMLDFDLVQTSKDFLKRQNMLQLDSEVSNAKDLERYGIFYKAPFDARMTRLLDASIDACVSTDTFEHIPKDDILEILEELKRILKPGGIITSKIDYSDHYSHTDDSIGPLNFLKFSDYEWKRFNHKNHYQSRLRHFEYKKLFEDMGFEVTEELAEYSDEKIEDDLIIKFAGYPSEWSATHGYFVVKKI